MSELRKGVPKMDVFVNKQILSSFSFHVLPFIRKKGKHEMRICFRKFNDTKKEGDSKEIIKVTKYQRKFRSMFVFLNFHQSFGYLYEVYLSYECPLSFLFLDNDTRLKC